MRVKFIAILQKFKITAHKKFFQLFPIFYPDNNKKYFSGEAQLWIETLNEKYSREDFVFADLLLYNLSILLCQKCHWYWFPKTYIFFSDFPNSQFRLFSLKFKSQYELKRIKELINEDQIEKIKALFLPMQKIKESSNNRYRYERAFSDADLILNYIKLEEIGSLN